MEEVVWVTQVFAQPLDGRLQQGLDAVNHNLESLWLIWNEWDGEKRKQMGFKGSPVEVMSEKTKKKLACSVEINSLACFPQP